MQAAVHIITELSHKCFGRAQDISGIIQSLRHGKGQPKLSTRKKTVVEQHIFGRLVKC